MATAAIGHNAPPDPFEAFRLHIDDLTEQAQQFLDGEPIQTEKQAEDVSRLVNMLRKAAKDADEARKAEKKPHDDAAKAVQQKWTPILSAVALATDTAKCALAPYLAAKEAEQRRIADEARKAAEEAKRRAEDAARAASTTDLAGQSTVRVLQEAAAEAGKQANRLDKAKAHARGGERAIGLRSYWRAEITDPVAFGKWAWTHRREEYHEFLTSLAEQECRHGPREMPGVAITEERKAV